MSALIALVAAIAAAIVFSGGDAAQSADTAPIAPKPADPSVIVEPSPDVLADRQQAFEQDFAVLRQPGGDEIPATSVIGYAPLDVGASRLLRPAPAPQRAAASRLAADDVEAPDATVWVTPRIDGAQCLLAQPPEAAGPAITCAMPDQAANGYFLLTLARAADQAAIFGLMPDGVEEVSVGLADGTSPTVPVVDNAYMAQFDQPTMSITWTDPDGVEQTLRATSEA